MKDEKTDLLFFALAHHVRRQMLDLLMAAPGMTVKALASHFNMTRIGVMKHLKVLEDADLVLSRKAGRSRQLFFNAIPIQQIHDRWTTQYSAFWAERMLDVKSLLEARAEGREKDSA